MVSGKAALLDQLIVSGCNFLIFVFAARFLPTEDVARYAYAFGFYMFLFMLAYAWIYQNVMASGKEGVDSALLANFRWLNVALVSVAFPLVWLLFHLMAGKSSGLVSADAFLATCFVAVNQVVDFCRRTAYFFDAISFWHSPLAISLLGFLPRIPMLAMFSPTTFDQFMIVLIISSFPALLLHVRDLIDSKPIQFFPFLKKQISDGKWMTLNIPVNWAWGQSPVYLIGGVLGMKAAGVYAAIRSITNIANVAMEMIPTFFASRLSYHFSTGDSARYANYLIKLVLIGFCAWSLGLIVLMTFSELILGDFLGGFYQTYGLVLQVFWGFNLALFATRIQFLHLRFTEKTFAAPIAHAVGVLVLALCFYHFRDSGLLAMGWALIAGGMSIVAIQLLMVFQRPS